MRKESQLLSFVSIGSQLVSGWHWIRFEAGFDGPGYLIYVAIGVVVAQQACLFWISAR
jgi:hypothetical protein